MNNKNATFLSQITTFKTRYKAMHLTTEQLNKLCTIAISAAKEAGELISMYRDVKTEVEFKKGGTTDSTVALGADSLAAQVVTEVDIKSQEIILKHLVPTLEPYDLGLLTEETVDDRSRFDKEYFWCVDPLDGTLPFIQGKPGYAVSIALVSNKGKALVGVVLDPVRQNLYHAVEKQGAFKNNEKIMTNNCSDVFSFIADGSFVTHPLFDGTKHVINQYCSLIGCESLKTNRLWGCGDERHMGNGKQSGLLF